VKSLTQEPSINYHHPKKANWKHSCVYKKKTGFICVFIMSSRRFRVNCRRTKEFQSQQKSMSYTYRFVSYNHRLLLFHPACFQENIARMKGICQSKRGEIYEPCSLTLATQSLLTDFWLLSHWSKVTPRTWKPPQRRQKTHSSWGCLPSFHRHASLLYPGAQGAVCLSAVGTHVFTWGVTVSPAAGPHSQCQGPCRP